MALDILPCQNGKGLKVFIASYVLRTDVLSLIALPVKWDMLVGIA
jgi:hypothetical protein